MQSLCVLAGVIAVATFSSGANAALIRLDNSRSGKDMPTNAPRAGFPVNLAPAPAEVLPGRTGPFSDLRSFARTPSFIELVGGAPWRESVNFDPHWQAESPRVTGARALARTYSGAPLLFAAGAALEPGLAARSPLLSLHQTLGAGWSTGGEWLVGEAMAAAPEASTTGLLLTGLGLLWLLRRRNSRLMNDTEQTSPGEGGAELLHLPDPQRLQLSHLEKQAGDPAISIRRAS